jgi:hypothetical protein
MQAAGPDDTAYIATGLRALSYTFVYLSGVNYLRKKPHLFTHLFDMLSLKSQLPP